MKALGITPHVAWERLCLAIWQDYARNGGNWSLAEFRRYQQRERPSFRGLVQRAKMEGLFHDYGEGVYAIYIDEAWEYL